MKLRRIVRKGFLLTCALGVTFSGVWMPKAGEVFGKADTAEGAAASDERTVVYAADSDSAEEYAAVSGLTAGVASITTKTVTPTITLTAGIASSLTDYDSGEVYIVAQEKIRVAAALAEEAYQNEKAADLAEWGYENLGIAVTDSTVNVRESASADADVVGKLSNHAACEIIKTDNGWAQIISGEVEGYVSEEFLLTGDEAYEIALEEAELVATVTTSDNLRVRASASTSAKILTKVSEGEELSVLSEEEDGWLYVSIDNTKGYVCADYVSVAEQLPTAQTMAEYTYGAEVSDVRISLVETALQYVGNPYVWGGTSLTNGVDCSGFTMRIYAMFGISLPHSSKAQPSYGTKISASEAQPGDLFFYGDGTTINHVAIYIGDGKIVHASTSRTGIKVSNAFYRDPICVVSYLD